MELFLAGRARDYVRGMWPMLQQPVPDDYVLATGEARSGSEFIELALAQIGVTIVWSGQNLEERDADAATGPTPALVDPTYFRATEVDHLVGDPATARD